MSLLLRAGLLVSLVLLAAGTIAYVADHPSQTPGQAISTNPILPLLSASRLGAGLAAGDPAAFLTLGLLVLVATPLLRVVSGAYYFGRHRERTMTTITVVVFALLLLGLLVLGPLIR